MTAVSVCPPPCWARAQWLICLIAALLVACAQTKTVRNAEALKGLENGQSQTAVFAAMGPPDLEQTVSEGRTVAFYQTRTGDSAASNLTPSLCTPVLFEDGKMVGIGAAAYERWIREEEERKRKIAMDQVLRREAQRAEAARRQREAQRKAAIATLEKKVRPIPAANAALNLKLYRQLLTLDPANARYRKKVAHYENRLEQQKADQKRQAERLARKERRQAWEQNRDKRNKLLRQYSGNGIVELAVYDMGNSSYYVWVKNVSPQIVTTHPDYFTLFDRQHAVIPCKGGQSLDRVLEPGSLSHGKIDCRCDCIPQELVFQNRESGRVIKSFWPGGSTRRDGEENG